MSTGTKVYEREHRRYAGLNQLKRRKIRQGDYLGDVGIARNLLSLQEGCKSGGEH